jgi:hypothetical protein
MIDLGPAPGRPLGVVGDGLSGHDPAALDIASVEAEPRCRHLGQLNVPPGSATPRSMVTGIVRDLRTGAATGRAGCPRAPARASAGSFRAPPTPPIASPHRPRGCSLGRVSSRFVRLCYKNWPFVSSGRVGEGLVGVERRRINGRQHGSTSQATSVLLVSAGAPPSLEGNVEEAQSWPVQKFKKFAQNRPFTARAFRPCADRRNKWFRTRCGSSAPRNIRRPASGRCSNNDRRCSACGLRRARRWRVRSRL